MYKYTVSYNHNFKQTNDPDNSAIEVEVIADCLAELDRIMITKYKDEFYQVESKQELTE